METLLSTAIKTAQTLQQPFGVSAMQRALKVGYNEASEVIDTLLYHGHIERVGAYQFRNVENSALQTNQSC